MLNGKERNGERVKHFSTMTQRHYDSKTQLMNSINQVNTTNLSRLPCNNSVHGEIRPVLCSAELLHREYISLGRNKLNEHNEPNKFIPLAM